LLWQSFKNSEYFAILRWQKQGEIDSPLLVVGGQLFAIWRSRAGGAIPDFSLSPSSPYLRELSGSLFCGMAAWNVA